MGQSCLSSVVPAVFILLCFSEQRRMNVEHIFCYSVVKQLEVPVSRSKHMNQ